MQIQISWLLNLHCLQRQSISGFSRTRVNMVGFYMPWKPHCFWPNRQDPGQIAWFGSAVCQGRSLFINVPEHNKTYNKTFATCENLAQPVHLGSLITVLIACAFYSLWAIQRGINEYLCHTCRMYTLIWVFVNHTGLIVGFVMRSLIGIAGLGGSVGCAVRLETRRSRVQPPPRSATFFRGDWSWNIFYGHSLPSADSRRAVVSFWRKNVHNTG